MKRKTLISAFVVALLIISMLTVAFAGSSGYSTELPAAGGHRNLTVYTTRDSTSSTMSNRCTKSISGETVYSFHTWVDQKDVGQVTNTLSVRQGDNSSYSMRAYPVAGSQCRGRGSTIGLLSAAMSVAGTIDFK